MDEKTIHAGQVAFDLNIMLNYQNSFTKMLFCIGKRTIAKKLLQHADCLYAKHETDFLITLDDAT